MKEKKIDIIALEFPDNVRTRPGMYIGATDFPNVILREAIDNSVDELMGSIKCDKIDIQLKNGQSGGWYVVSDNGRGIPIQLDEQKGITKTEMAVGMLNAGSKFDKKEGDISVGLNGVGISSTNALSERFVILSIITNENFDKSIPEVKTAWENIGNPYYILEYSKGRKIFESALGRKDIIEKYGFEFPELSSTVTAFIPDKTIWDSIHATYSKKSLAYIGIILRKFYQKDCIITIDGEVVNDNYVPYRFEFTKDIKVYDNIKDRYKTAKFYVNFDVDKDMSICDLNGSINSLVVDRGLHIDWCKKSYQEAFKNHYNIHHDYTWCGLKMSVICLTSNADFSSQTKERCVKIDNLYYDEVLPHLMCEFHNIFGKNEDYFKVHLDRVNEFAEALTQISAIQKVKNIVGTLEGGNRVRSKLPSTVKDAASNDRSRCELFIVEGKSAGGTMIRARDAEYHAILELRGIPLNAINLDLDTIMDNPEMNGIVTAIGAGVNEYFRIEQCRYGKIILAADSDPDGEKINSMILGFIAKKMTFLIDSGMVYVALAPLFHQKIGNKDIYSYPGDDFTQIIDFDKPFKRYKGLGEINIQEAKEFFFDPNKRILLQITPSNLSYVFELLTLTYARKDLMIRENVINDPFETGIL